jgi:hypothetical protein
LQAGKTYYTSFDYDLGTCVGAAYHVDFLNFGQYIQFNGTSGSFNGIPPFTAPNSGTFALEFFVHSNLVNVCEARIRNLQVYYIDTVSVTEYCDTVYVGGWRYGFGNQERADEISGKRGGGYTAEFWEYNPLTGRRSNRDPLFPIYAWQSPYATFNNSPIWFRDPLGLEGEDPNKQVPKGAPENPSEGDRYTSENGRTWEYWKNDEGGGEWARYDGKTPEVVIYPEAKKAEFKKEYERIYNNEHSIMGQFFGDMTGWGVRPFYDPLKDHPDHPMRKSWEYRRAQVEAANDIVNGVLQVGTLPLGGGLGGSVRTAALSFFAGAVPSFVGQLNANSRNIGDVDWISVGASGVGGIFKNPWMGATVATTFDAMFDYNTKFK